METLMILAAVVACAIAGVTVVSMTKRGRRAPMRMPNELDDDDTEMLIGAMRRSESPIDRTVQILDLEPIEPGRMAERDADDPPRRIAGTMPDAAGRSPSETR
jgi:hypothetical protein